MTEQVAPEGVSTAVPDLDPRPAIRQLMADKLGIRVDSDETDLLQEGALDSVALVNLILHLEQRFSIRIELAELEIDDLRSVCSIANLIRSLQDDDSGSDILLAHATGITL